MRKIVWICARVLICWVSVFFGFGVLTTALAQEPSQTEALSLGTKPTPFRPDAGLQMLIATKSGEAQAHVTQGLAYLLTFWDEAAYREFKRAVELDSDCLMAHWGLALSTITPFDEREEEKVNSLRRLQDIVKTQKLTNREVAYAETMLTLLKEGPHATGEAFAKIAGQWRSDEMATLFAVLFYRDGFSDLGDPKPGQVKAREMLDELIAKKPSLFAACFLRALIEETNPDVDAKTVEQARYVVGLAPEYAPAQLLLGHFLFRTGEYEQAEKCFTRAAELYNQWAICEGIKMADNDGYFRALVYRATSEWCRGDKAKAKKTARDLALLPVDTKRPKSKGTLIQLWEVRSLPLRLTVSEYPCPSRKDFEKVKPQDLALAKSELSHVMLALAMEFASSRLAFSAKDVSAMRQLLTNVDKIAAVLLPAGPQAEKSSCLSYWMRSLWMADRMILEGKAMLYSDSATLWLKNAVDSQKCASLLLPPILPYPAEWTLARHYLSQGDAVACIGACEQGLKRFPNHASLLKTKKIAQDSLSNKKTDTKPKLKGCRRNK
ncbi:MAG: hypothetical protein RR419_03950 [Akkermansia sp.]